MKLLGKEKFLDTVINQAIKEINTICNKPDFKEKAYEESKAQLLDNLEKINTYSNNDKIGEVVFEPSLLESFKKLQEQALSDQEITEHNDKMCFNLLNLQKKAFENSYLKNSDKLTEEDFVDMLIGIIKEKSHYRDAFLEALKTLSGFVLNKELFEKFLKDKVDKNLIDALFNANENYLEDLPVSSEINNLLCVICIRSDDLAKYIVEKGGLQNIIEEIRSLIKLNDPVSQSKKLFGLKFIESLVKDKENMEKFVQLKGADLVLGLMKSCIQFQDEQNSKKIDQIKESEKSHIINHNNFVVRNSVFNHKQNIGDKNYSVNNEINQVGKNIKLQNNRIISNMDEDNLINSNYNNLGSEIIEDLKNQSILNANSNDNKIESATSLININDINHKLDKLSNYITETPIRIHENKNISNKKFIENQNQFDLNNKNIGTLDDSDIDSNSTKLENSFNSYEENNLNDDFFLSDEIEINTEKMNKIENSITNMNVKTNNFIPYLVYCFKIIQINLNFKMKDFIDPRLFKNVIQLLK